MDSSRVLQARDRSKETKAVAAWKARFVTRKEMPPVFAASAIPVYTWSLLIFFRNLRAWLYYLPAWDIAGILAYSLAFAFVESALVLLAWVALAALLPASWFRDRFVALGAMAALWTGLWAVLAQWTGLVPFTSLARKHPARLGGSISLYLVAMGAACWSIRRQRRVGEGIASLANRMVVLLYLYLPLSACGLLVVLVRNLLGSP